jgi:hypothetical protein
MMTFEEYFEDRLRAAFLDAAIPVGEEVYGAYILLHNEDDHPARPTFRIVSNSESRLAAEPGADPDEARWDYAWWTVALDQPVALLGGSTDPETMKRLRAWLADGGLGDEPDHSTPEWQTWSERGDELSADLARLCARIARTLHDDGTVEKAFGRPIPIIVSAFGPDDDIIDNTRTANPPGLADPAIASLDPDAEA